MQKNRLSFNSSAAKYTKGYPQFQHVETVDKLWAIAFSPDLRGKGPSPDLY